MKTTPMIWLTVLTLAIWPQRGLAQTQVTPTLAVADKQADEAVEPTEADLQALIFYLQQQDELSATAELDRLRAEFVNWVPPEDLGQLIAAQPSVEIDTIFRHIADGQLVEARAALDATRAAYRGWKPQADMIYLLELAEGQALLDAALTAGNTAEALRIATSTDGLLRCDRVNNAWRIAAAQEAQGAKTEAVATYRAVVHACVNFAEVSATLEKSNAATTDAELTELFNVAIQRFPYNSAAIHELYTRLMAGRGHSAVPGASDPAPKIRPKPRPDRRAAASDAPSNGGGDAGKPRAAAASDGSEISSDWAVCLAQTQGTRKVQPLFKRGWCAYNLDRPMDALAAFGAVENQLSPEQRRDARYGMALSYLKLNMTEDAARIVASTDLTKSQRVETESIILDQRGVLAFLKKDYERAIGYFDALEHVSGNLRRDLAIMRAYSYLNTGYRQKAHAMFLDLHQQMATRESSRGLELSKLD
jgi:cellulose synthase operon protein C